MSIEIKIACAVIPLIALLAGLVTVHIECARAFERNRKG